MIRTAARPGKAAPSRPSPEYPHPMLEEIRHADVLAGGVRGGRGAPGKIQVDAESDHENREHPEQPAKRKRRHKVPYDSAGVSLQP